jgi:nitronate monooxygenase
MLHTRVCDVFGIQIPIVNAPMAIAAGGELAAAVSGAGGLGLIGAMRHDAHWLQAQIRMVRERTDRPFGVGFVTHWLPDTPELYETALEERVPVIMHSFVDPAPYMPAAKKAGAKVICQVQTVEGAVKAAQAQVDAIVAQGTQAGGHTGLVSTMTLVPAVVRAVSPLPVIAAGGIADGRTMAATLALGAQGALIGTAFLASPESGYTPNQKRRILHMNSSDTVLTRVFEIARGDEWPDDIAGRADRNAFVDRWHGREEQLRSRLQEAAEALAAAIVDDDVSTAPVWAGTGVGLVNDTGSAGDIVRRIASEAERDLRDFQV